MSTLLILPIIVLLNIIPYEIDEQCSIEFQVSTDLLYLFNFEPLSYYLVDPEHLLVDQILMICVPILLDELDRLLYLKPYKPIDTSPFLTRY